MRRALLRPLAFVALAALVFWRCGRFDGPRVPLFAGALLLALASAALGPRGRAVSSGLATLALLAAALDYALHPADASAPFALALAALCLVALLVLVAPTPERRARAGRALLAAIGVALALLGAELVARRVWPRAPHSIVPIEGSAAPDPFRPDPALVHAPVPGFRGRFVHVEYGGELFASNSDGFRDREWPREWPEGEQRVLVLGDSMVAGYGVRAEEALPALLEEELRVARPDVPLRVLNAGVAGYSPRHERALLELLLPRVRPHHVVCVFYDGNDLPDARRHFERTEERAIGRPAEPEEPPRTLFDREYWWRYSQLFRLVEARLALRFPALGMPRPFHAYEELLPRMRVDPSPEVIEELAIARDSLVEMHELSTAAGAGFLVARLPARTQAEPRTLARLFAEHGLDPALHDPARPGSALLADCRAAGLATLDLLPELEWSGEGRSPDYFFEGHLDRRGHRRAAEALARSLAERIAPPAGR